MNIPYSSNTAKFFIVILITLLISFLSGCSGDEPETENEPSEFPERLVTYERTNSTSAATLKAVLALGNFNLSQDIFQYDVNLFRVEYNTNYKGNEITTSAIVAIPQTSDEISVISIQHGTISADKDAPTNLPVTDSFAGLLQAVASTGFVAIAPDFIGFGSSSDIVHPYYVESLTASSILDGIYSGIQVADRESINLSGKLFLAGYSQGGYATMATHKLIEESQLDNLGLVASFPAAGGYDLTGFQKTLFSLETYHQPFYLAYVAEGYRTAGEFDESLDLIFNEPFASRIPSLFDGSKTGSQINEQLTNSIPELVNAELLSGIDSDPKFSFFSTALKNNSLTDWIPQKPMYLYHGDADITVPYQNSVDSYNQFINNGASEEIVKFITLREGTHATALAPYIEQFVPVLIELNK